VREVCDRILRAQGHMPAILERLEHPEGYNDQ